MTKTILEQSKAIRCAGARLADDDVKMSFIVYRRNGDSVIEHSRANSLYNAKADGMRAGGTDQEYVVADEKSGKIVYSWMFDDKGATIPKYAVGQSIRMAARLASMDDDFERFLVQSLDQEPEGEAKQKYQKSLEQIIGHGHEINVVKQKASAVLPKHVIDKAIREYSKQVKFSAPDTHLTESSVEELKALIAKCEAAYEKKPTENIKVLIDNLREKLYKKQRMSAGVSLWSPIKLPSNTSFTVYQVKPDGTLSGKEHLNSPEEVADWYSRKNYGQVCIVNDKTGEKKYYQDSGQGMKEVRMSSDEVGTPDAPAWPQDEQVLPGGLGDKLTPADVDPIEFELGMEMEKEHTPDEQVRQEIVLDHLAEDPAYYSKLKQMEGLGVDVQMYGEFRATKI